MSRRLFPLVLCVLGLCLSVTANPCEPDYHDDWVWRGETSTCYLPSNHTRTFTEALQFCEELNGTLASIGDEMEDQFIQEKVRKCTDAQDECASTYDPNQQHWIGLVKTLDPGRTNMEREILKKYWRWLDGTVYNTTFMRWYVDRVEDVYEPNGDSNSRCVRLISTGYWSDQMCGMPFRFICEKVMYLEPAKPVNVGLAVGMTFLVFLLIAITILIVLWCLRRMRGLKDFDEDEPDSEVMATMYYDPNIDKHESDKKGLRDPNRNVPQEDECQYTEVRVAPARQRGSKNKKNPLETEQFVKNTDTGPIAVGTEQTIPKEVEAGFAPIYAVPNKTKTFLETDIDEDPYTPTIVDNVVYDDPLQKVEVLSN